MAIDFKFNPNDLQVIVSLSVLTVGFILYWFISNSESLERKITKRIIEKNKSIIWNLYQKTTGFLFLGIIPGIICLTLLDYDLYYYGLNFKNLRLSLLYILILGVIIIPMAILSSRKESTYSVYPQIRVKDWNINLVLINAISWACYLFAYEMLFRGFLLKGTLPVLGLWPAVAVNVSLYSCTHIPKGAKETIAAIPFGFILCILTIQTGTIWVAFLAHLTLALTNDFAALYFNPGMRIVGLRKSTGLI